MADKKTRRRWLDQTDDKYNGTALAGNCAEACIASLLGLDLDEVPDFHCDGFRRDSNSAYWLNFRNFVARHGYMLEVRGGTYQPMSPVMYLATGRSYRGVPHMVVMRDGDLLHDPHHARKGLKWIDRVWLLVPHDPLAR